MLRVQLLLNNNENIGEIHIQNDATGDRDIGNYSVWLYEGPWEMNRVPKRSARVAGHQKKNGAWFLTYCAIQALNIYGDDKA